jgi:hypothetical protein
MSEDVKPTEPNPVHRKPNEWKAIMTRDEMRVVKDLAFLVLKSKQNVGRRLLDVAESVRRIVEDKERQ